MADPQFEVVYSYMARGIRFARAMWRGICTGFPKLILRPYVLFAAIFPWIKLLIFTVALIQFLSACVFEVATALMSARDSEFSNLFGVATKLMATTRIMLNTVFILPSVCLFVGLMTDRRVFFWPWFILMAIFFGIFGYQIWKLSFSMALLACLIMFIQIKFFKIVWREYQAIKSDAAGRYNI